MSHTRSAAMKTDWEVPTGRSQRLGVPEIVPLAFAFQMYVLCWAIHHLNVFAIMQGKIWPLFHSIQEPKSLSSLRFVGQADNRVRAAEE